MEYISGITRVHLGNYSIERMAKLKEYLDEINAVRVVHYNIHPRNMAVVIGKDETRVMWIDFDRAQTYPRDEQLTEAAQERFHTESTLMRWWMAPSVC